MSKLMNLASDMSEILDSITKLAISEITEDSVISATPEDLMAAQLVIQFKDTYQAYLKEEATEIETINQSLKGINTKLDKLLGHGKFPWGKGDVTLTSEELDTLLQKS